MTTGHGGAARGYSWEPFGPGHELSVTHGAFSQRRTGPIAEKYERHLLEEGPAHLRGDQAATFYPLVRQYAQVAAQVELLGGWVGESDLIAAVTETAVEEEEVSHSKGKSRRRSTTQRTRSAMDAYARALSRLITLSDRLLLSPQAMARAKLDTSPKVDVMVMMQQRIEELDREASGGR